MKRSVVATYSLCALMLCSAAFAQWARPTEHLSDKIGSPNLEEIFPTGFGGWRMDNSTPLVMPSPEVQAKLDTIYNQVLARTYVNAEGQRIMLSVAYGGDQANGTRAHRPEVCYPAQGFQITSSAQGLVPIGTEQLPVKLLNARLGQRHEPITYWIVVGGQVATSHSEQKLTELKFSMKGLIADGMLVRISSIDTNQSNAYQVQANFISDLASGVSPAAKARIFGQAPDAS